MVRVWSTVNSHSMLLEIPNDTATLEDILAVSHKTNFTLTI